MGGWFLTLAFQIELLSESLNKNLIQGLSWGRAEINIEGNIPLLRQAPKKPHSFGSEGKGTSSLQPKS